MTFQRIRYRGHNGYDVSEASDEATLHPADVGISLTVQAQAEDADLNVLMERFGVTGKMPENVNIPTYGDFSGITDYRTALEAVRDAHESFMEIPAKIRARFDNDPQQYMEFCAQPGNRAEMREMGLLKPEVNNVGTSGQPGGANPGNGGTGQATTTGASQDGSPIGGRQGNANGPGPSGPAPAVKP